MSKQRWKDTLPETCALATSLTWVAGSLSVAMRANEDESRDISAAYAAAHIRAYRKSLGVKSKRCESLDEGMTPEELLWSAMSHLCYAGLFHDDEAKYTAYHLRAAEADLRELWKRGQA